MQEVLNLVKVIKSDITALRNDIAQLSKTHTQHLNEEWIQRDEVMKILKIGKRKLQSMRDNGQMPFSQIDGKIYYRTSDVESLLTGNYNKR
jgi:hypothetical protein